MEGLRLEIGDGRIEIEGSVGEEALSAVKLWTCRSTSPG